MMPSTGQQTGTTEIGKLRKTHYLQQHNQSSVFTLPSTIAHSRREPRRILARWWRLHGLCLATGGPQPSIQSASYNLKHNNYRAVAPAYWIIKASGNVPWACSLQKKIPKPCLRGTELYNWFSHGLLRAAKSQFQKKIPNLGISQNFSEFLRISQNFSKLFRISERFGRKWSVLANTIPDVKS